MSCWLEHRTFRSGNTYDLKPCPEMSAQEEQTAAESEPNEAERISETGSDFSLDLIEERIEANLEVLHAQISTLTQMMDNLI